jgi:hypothetical protein
MTCLEASTGKVVYEGEAAYACPAISNGRILIWTEAALYSISNGG